MKSATTELMHLAIFRAGAFGEDEHRITTFHTLADMCQHLFHRHRGGEEIGEPYHMAIDLAIPHPLSRHHNKTIGEHQRCRKVKQRLMVGNDKCRLLEGLFIRVAQDRIHLCHAVIGKEAAEPAYMSMQTITHTFIIAKPGIDPGQGGNDEENVSEQDAKFKICNNKS